MIRRASTLAVLSLLALGHAYAGEEAARSYYLIDGFSTALPSSESLACTVSEAEARPGMAARLHYRIEGQAAARIELPQNARQIPRDGTLQLWVKADNSGNQLQLSLTYGDRRQEHLEAVPLNFDGWREQSFTVANVNGRRGAWLSRISINKTGEKSEGEVVLDNLRLYPASGEAPPAAVVRLDGPSVREYSDDVCLLLEMSYFGKEPISVNAEVTMVDHDENMVAERSFADIAIAGGESREVKLDLRPENLHLYRPPFRVRAEIYSADEPQLAATIDERIVMGNSWLLFDDLSNVFGRWFVSGMASSMRPEGWNTEHFGQMYRTCAQTQKSTRISRVEIDRTEGAADNAPPGRYAMQIDYNGLTMVYNGIHRYLPGDAYRIGVWVQGNGSDAVLHALVFDFSAPGHTMYTWKRHFGISTLCTLNFEGWRYFEAPLPGNGIGPRTQTGSTDAIDFPLELSAFAIVPGKAAAGGSVRIGPIFLHTQQTRADALSVQMGYDEPNHEYAPGGSAWATVQNGWRIGKRSIAAAWSLFDRDDNMLVSGSEGFELEPMGQRTFRIDLAPHAGKIADASGPLRLQVKVDDTQEAAGTEAEIILAKPDSVALIADFESDRGYLGLAAYGVSNAPPPGEIAARTTKDQRKSGERSLAMPWRKNESFFVSVDPPVPGVPTTISLMVHGDGSNVLFYPLIGDQPGVITGVDNAGWDLFLPQAVEGDLQNAAKVDWKGWRNVSFRLPLIPRSWRQARPVLPFVPSYPLGVHLAVVATGDDVAAANGTLYVDDISVETHLRPDERLAMRLGRQGESNLALPGSDVRVRLFNFEANNKSGRSARKATVKGGLYNWRGERASGTDTPIELAPGASQTVVVAQDVAPGAYSLRVELAQKEGKQTIASIAEDFLVADAESLLGPEWQDALRDAAKLRAPLRDRFALIHHDWDWAEFQPGNLQAQTLLACAAAVKRLGQDPYMLLGYSAYWATGPGYVDMLNDRLSDREDHGPGGRDWGHTVDIFHTPERMDDWENYVLGMMRLAGRHVSGWFLWNTPDSRAFLGVSPEKFAQIIKVTNKWRQQYCPDTPLILGGLSRDTAIPYLRQLSEHNALDDVTGVNVRIDGGRISPEDGQLPEYVEQLQRALRTGNGADRTIILSDLDWGVGKSGGGIDAFDQAAYLARAALLLDQLGVHPTLMLHNEDTVRHGFGLTYKRTLTIPPLVQKLPAFQFKPAWLSMVRVKQLLSQAKVVGEIAVQDIVAGRTRCLLYERPGDRKPVAVVWRNDSEGALSFAQTGLTVTSAEDILGAPVPTERGWYRVGKMPALFVLNGAEEPAWQALSRLRVRDGGEELSWPQAVVAAFEPTTGQRQDYQQTGGARATFTGRTAQGRRESWPGLEFLKGGSERFEVDVSEGAGLVLRKRYFLGEVIAIDEAGRKHRTDDVHGLGHAGDLIVNGRPQGRWNLKRVAEELTGGLREAIFLIDTSALAGAKRAVIEVRYPGPANTAGWVLCAYHGGGFPLSALGPIHADSKVTKPRIARNVAGLQLRVGKKAYRNGVGVFAPCLIDYPLNGQFRRFTADVGVDAAAEGRGSVVFEIQGDGRRLWKSSVVTGLDEAQPVDLDVTNVDRLRLIVTDGGDGNKLDAANWCDATLHR